jgi:hypothetical protein
MIAMTDGAPIFSSEEFWPRAPYAALLAGRAPAREPSHGEQSILPWQVQVWERGRKLPDLCIVSLTICKPKAQSTPPFNRQ